MRTAHEVETFEDPELVKMRAEVARLSTLVANREATYTQIERLTHLRNILRRAQKKGHVR